MTKLVLFLATSLLICSSFFAAGVSAQGTLLDKICRMGTNYKYKYDDCINALSADPKSKNAESLAELGRITMRIAIANATRTLYYIRQKKEAGGSVAYKNCEGLYGLSIGNFVDVMSEIDEDPFTARKDVRLAAESASRCSMEMSATKMRDAVMGAGDLAIELFSKIGAAITDQLS